jgi:hypothetical protein
VALSDEQNAMLRLLAQGEQSYADIAALMGLSEEEVRAKVVGALAQLQAEGKPAPDVPPPIPGGAHPAAEATPPEPEPVAETKPADAEPEPAVSDAVAPKAAIGDRGGAPKSGSDDAERHEPAAAPVRPAPRSPKPASTPPSSRRPTGGRTVTLPSGRKAWLLGGGVIAAIVVIVVVILLVSGGGGDSSSTASTEGTTTTAAEEGKAENTAGAKAATQAKLTAVDGSEAEGLATFGRVKNKLALQIEAKGLEPSTKGNSYVIWLAQSPKRMLPLAYPVPVAASGKAANAIAAQFEVPIEVLAYLANGTFDQIAITKVVDKSFEAGVKVAEAKKTAPAYTGETVLRGTIAGPIVGFAIREEEAKKAEKEGK